MHKRIQVLPTLLANQIAAGEVVERPASVLKELLENSIDAGATHIEITVERGGIGLIRVQDDGIGIYKEDLKVAIAQHATSKISSLSDLEKVESYGFRGEALASISSVSRLKLSSYVIGEDCGWCLESAGRNAECHLAPAPKKPGTIVEARDLFFNTPARRHFLRTEKTELFYLEEVFKRIALSQPHIAFKFQQGDRIQKRLPMCKTVEAETKRVALLCGQSFIDNAYYIEVEGNGLHLKGWLGSATAMRAQADLQYFYVNGRIVRDKVVMHAIRQVFQEMGPPGRYPAYVLFFTLDPASLDVNVHPTKHEVRFREARRVHAFLSYAIKESLSEGKKGESKTFIKKQGELDFSFLETEHKADLPLSLLPITEVKPRPILTPDTTALGKVIGMLGKEFLLVLQDQSLVFIDIKASRKTWLTDFFMKAYHAKGVKKRPLLMPKSLVVGKSIETFEASQNLWDKLGFDISQVGQDVILVRAVPDIFGAEIEGLEKFFRQLLLLTDLKEALTCIIEYMVEHEVLTESEIMACVNELQMQNASYRELPMEKIRSLF